MTEKSYRKEKKQWASVLMESKGISTKCLLSIQLFLVSSPCSYIGADQDKKREEDVVLNQLQDETLLAATKVQCMRWDTTLHENVGVVF